MAHPHREPQVRLRGGGRRANSTALSWRWPARQVHRPVWTAAASVRLFGRCWLIEGVGELLTPCCLQGSLGLTTASLGCQRAVSHPAPLSPTPLNGTQ